MAAAGALPPAVLQSLDQARLESSALALWIGEADGVPVLAWQPDQPVQVASLLKLPVTLAALEQLGPAFRFHTDLLADPVPPGRARARRPAPAEWQLALRGGGDPGLREADLRHMLREARARGVTRIAGPVVLDAQRFAPQPAVGAGVLAAPDDPWAVAPGALVTDLAAVTLTLSAPGTAMTTPLAEPDLPVHWVRSAAVPGCPEDWPAQVALQVVAPEGPAAVRSPLLQLADAPHPDCGLRVLRRSPMAASPHFAAVLDRQWQALGGAALQFASGTAPGYATVLVQQDSRPLAELVRDTNKYSSNLMAGMLLLDLAAEAGWRPATLADGERVLKAWARSRNLSLDGLVLDNGAGLSHAEQLAPAQLGALLVYALTSDVAPEFLASLPIPGQDGTLRRQFRDLPRAGAMRLKTGSLDGVRALAGYVRGPDGRWRVVVSVLQAPEAHLQQVAWGD